MDWYLGLSSKIFCLFCPVAVPITLHPTPSVHVLSMEILLHKEMMTTLTHMQPTQKWWHHSGHISHPLLILSSHHMFLLITDRFTRPVKSWQNGNRSGKIRTACLCCSAEVGWMKTETLSSNSFNHANYILKKTTTILQLWMEIDDGKSKSALALLVYSI